MIRSTDDRFRLVRSVEKQKQPLEETSMLSPFARMARRSVLFTSRIVAIATTVYLVASCGSDSADTPRRFSTVVVLGASGADTGNRCGIAADPLCFPAPPYAGRSTATNGTSAANPGGRLYPQLIAARYGAPLTASSAGGLNFATGGARTGAIPTDTVPATIPSMQAQLDQSIARLNPQFIAQTLFIVDGSAFGNNIRRTLELLATASSPAAAQALVTAAIQQGAADIGLILTRIYSLGVRNIVLSNATDLGRHPAVVAAGPAAVTTATAMATNFNAALQGVVIPQVLAASPGLNIYLINFGQTMAQVFANPASFGISNTTAPCYPFFSVPTAPACANPDQYFFWDELHPSAAIHALAVQTATLPAP